MFLVLNAPNFFLFRVVSDYTRPAMSKTSLNFGFFTTSIKIWTSRSPSHLREPPRKQSVMVCDLRLVDFDPFYVFQGFWASEFGRVFFLYTEKLQVYIPKVKIVPQGFQIQKKHSYKRVKTNRYVPANIYFCRFCSFLPPIFDKHSGGYRNGLIDVAEKPKILKRFWQRRSRWG